MKNFTKNTLHGNFGYPLRWLASVMMLIALTMSTIANAQTATLGSGTAVSVANSGSGLGPVNSYYHYMHYQVVYTAAEITAAGGAAGLISQFGWNVYTASAVVLPNYRIRMAQTTATNSATHNTDALTEVYNSAYTSTTGYNMFNLAPFIWNGTSNILVDVCYGSADYVSPYGQVFVYGTEANSSRFSRSDEAAQCSITTDNINAFKPQARFVFTEVPSCLPPSGVTASVVTSSGATLGWTAPATAPSAGYQYYYSATNTAPTAGTEPTGITTGTSVQLTGLPSMTTQYFWIRSNCGSSTSTWFGPVSFTTSQVAATLPYTENFEGATPVFTIVNGTQTNKWVIGTATANGGTHSLYVSNDNGTTNNYSHTAGVVHAYRDITLPSDIVQARLSFDYRGVGESTYDYVRVWALGTDVTPAAGTAITTANSNNGVMIAEYVNLRNSYETLSYIIPAAAYAGQTVRLVFEWRNDGGGGSSPAGSIDNISVTAVSCFAPTALTTAVTAGSVRLNWTAPATVPSAGYDYYYSTTNTAPVAGTTISGNVPSGTTLNLTTLTPDTVYYIWLRSNCGTENSIWASGGSFRTDCAAAQPSAAYETFATYNGTAASPACWREATGSLTGTPPITFADSNWTNENYNNAAGANGLAARVELYGTRNAWFISPAIDLGNGSTDYQVEFNTSLIQWSSTTPITTMAEKYVKVVVSTDGGITWNNANVIRTYDSSNMPLGGIAETISLANYSGVVKIGFYAYSTATDLDFRFYVDNYRVREIPNCLNPLALTLGTVGENTAQISWTAPTIAPSAGYQYYVSPVNTAPTAATTATGSVATGVTTTVGSLAPSSLNYIWVRSNCGDSQSEWIGPLAVTTLCDGGDILSTTDGSVCGQGSATLEATANENATISWYAAAAGGAPLATGATFNTPVVTETTDFYVSAGNTINNLDVAVGAGATTSSTYSNPFYSLWSNNHTQHLITAAELTAAGILPGNINSIGLDVTSAGTLPMVDLSVKIGTTTATAMTAFVTNATLATVYTNASYMPVTGINTLVFTAPFTWDGTSNILVEFCHGNSASSATMDRTVRADNTSYVSSVKYHVSSATAASAVCGTTTGSNLTSYSVRPKFIFNGAGLCNSARQAVTATVTQAVAIAATATDSSICNGESTGLSVTSDNANYTYVWTPGNLTGATQTVSPTATTVYTVTATDTATNCVITQDVTVTVNLLPNAITVSPIEPVCINTAQELAITGASVTRTATVGNATTQTDATEELTAFSNRRITYRSQTIYTAAELRAAGLQAGNIVSIAYNISTIGDGATNANYTVKIGTTANDVFANSTYQSETGFTTVYGPATYTHAIGVNTIPFTTPFVWDGVSNLVISVSHSGADSINNARTYYTDNGVNTTIYNYNNLTATTGTVTAKRLNVTFAASAVSAVTWSPVTNLYTDAAATTPYTAGTDAATVYVKSGVASAATYTATATNTAGCTVNTTVDVTVTSTVAPAAQATQTFCTQAVVSDLDADGENIRWYADATGGSPLDAGSALTDDVVYYASQTVNGCESAVRTPVTVTITTVQADAPADVVSCFDYILPALTNGNYYTAPNGGGEMLDAGRVITETTLLYVFAQSGTCTEENNFVVTISGITLDTPEDVTTCNSYMLPNLTVGNYFTQQGGVGTPLAVGTSITQTTVIYIFAQSGTTPNCTSETSFTVTISSAGVVQGASPQNITAATAAEATIEDIVVTATGTVLWYTSEDAALAGGEPLAAGTQVTAGTTYYAVQTVGECRSTQVLAVLIEQVLGDKGFDASSFSYYPNPVNNVLNLSYSSEITSVAVFNLLGQRVIEQQPKAATAKLDTSVLAEGTYLVRVTVGNVVKTIKVVKKDN